MENQLLYKILKYLAEGIAIYLLFRFVPNQSLSQTDIILMTFVIMLVYILFENLNNLYAKNTTKSCPIVCPAQQQYQQQYQQQLEGMTNISESESEEIRGTISISPEMEQKIKSKFSSEDKAEQEHIKKSLDDEIKFKAEVREQKSDLHRELQKSDEAESEMAENEMAKYKSIGSRKTNGILLDELGYTDYNHLPMSGLNTGSFEYGYSFLPPAQWYPQPPNPPVCVTDNKCPVCPINTQGWPVDVKEWNDTRRITPPDRINVDYVQQKLNSGR
jgi:nitrate/TMAO reductase-like tetraheme cytochrome c subunit